MTARRSRPRTSCPRSSAGRCAIRWARCCGPRSPRSRRSMPRPSRSCSRRRPASCCRRWASPRATCPSSCPSASPRPIPSSRSRTTPAPGPFIFVKDEWKPGDKTVYVKNPKYKPRAEPPSGLAGGKIAKVDRVEWVAMPDQQTAMNALLKGEIDIIEIAAARPLQGHGGRPQHQAGQPQQVGQPVHLPLQPALQAVRQSQDPPGRALRLQPEGLSRRRDRRSQVVQDLQGDVHVRHALRELQGLRGQVRIRTSPRPRSS